MEAKLLEEQGMQSFIERSREIQSIEKMPGDASTRRYYRVRTHAKGDALKSLVVMVMEPFQDQGESLPFLKIQKHLFECGVDVPRVLETDPARGFIMLEDLGDVTLLRRLQEVATPEIERRYFERAIDALVNMHAKTGPRKGSEALSSFQLRFDLEKLMWEVNFTIEHFYQKHLQREIAASDLQIMTEGFVQICNELQNEPTVFTHRDYHSRNLMVTEDPMALEPRFVMIDFQDARMGPCQYDLASLLRDSYYQLDENQIHLLTRYYLSKMEAMGAPIQNSAHFERIFDLMSVQRNFKAIGSFASFLNRRGNPGYLKFIGNTFENIRRNLLKYPEYKKLREVLYYYYYF